MHHGPRRGASAGIATVMRIAMSTIRALIVHHHCLVTPFWTTADGLAEGWIGTRNATAAAAIATQLVSPRIAMSVMRRSTTVTGMGRTVAPMRMVRRIAMRRRRTVAMGSMMARRRSTVVTSVRTPSAGVSRRWATVICGMITVRGRRRRATATTATAGILLLTVGIVVCVRSPVVSVAPATSAALGTLLLRRRLRLSIFSRHSRRRRTVMVPVRRSAGSAAASIAKNVLRRRRTPVVRRGIVMSMRRRRSVAVSRRSISAIGRHVMRGRSVAIARRRSRRMTMRWRCTSLIGVGFGRLLPLAPTLFAARRRRFRPRFWHGGIRILALLVLYYRS
mmetsp:Transcript_5238/g.14857  ORF Transcript_5238/g.14857 Transcript_5238/m.14857 type:complete len:335 (-) Transcript_5238:286-1290(-)